MKDNLELQNEDNVDKVNSTFGYHIDPVIKDTIVQFYCDRLKIVSDNYKNYHWVSGLLEDDNGEPTDEFYYSVFIKERDRIYIFTELVNGKSIEITSIPNGYIDQIETEYQVVNGRNMMVNFKVKYENGQEYGNFKQDENETNNIIAETFSYLTEEKYIDEEQDS